MDRPLDDFDESKFKAALQKATGVLATKVRIASIRQGSSVVTVEGDVQYELRAEQPVRIEATGKPVAKKHVFLSYCRDNKKEAARLRDDLMAAGEVVWWDQDILPGVDWKLAIRQAMKDSYAVVLCLSKETEARATSGLFPEALDAIAAYREYGPGSIFLIPVRLSECTIPPFEIDGTRTLDRLQYVDLFPAAQRSAGVQRLIESLRATAYHP